MNGNCGATGSESSVTWKLEQNNKDNDNPTYTLTISYSGSGSGEMCDSFDSVVYPSDSNVMLMTTYGASVTKIVVDEGVTSIAANLTRNTKNVEVSIPASVKSISAVTEVGGDDTSGRLNAFGNNATSKTDEYGIAKITVDSENTYYKMVDGVLFSYDGTQLIRYTNEAAADYTVPNGVTHIAAKAFSRNSHLTSVTLNDGLLYIGMDAFDSIAGFAELTIPSTVKNIGASAFNCPIKKLVFKCGNINCTEAEGDGEGEWQSRFFDRNNTTLTTLVFENATKVYNHLFGDKSKKNGDSYGYSYLKENKITVYASEPEIADSFSGDDGVFANNVTSYAVSCILAITNGGTVTNPETYDFGTLATPVKDGYKFEGWYSDSSFTTEVTNQTLTAGSTYYAKWTRNPSVIYAVSVSETENGTVKASATWAVAGQTVTLTVTPEAHYALQSLTVTDASGKALTLTDKGDGKYSFTMPASRVRVAATFAENCPAKQFTDVDLTQYYHEALDWAVAEGVTDGTSATTFSPDSGCTRAQAVTFLWRAAGSPTATGNNPFTDVDADAYYYDAVLWAVEQGITVGTSATTFSPDVVCTRAHIVTMLYRAAGEPETSTAGIFTDVPANAYYAVAVSWAVENDVTTGTSATTFSPNDDCTRAQIVTFLYRAQV